MSKFLSFVLFLLFSSDVVAFSLSMSESAQSGAVGVSNRRSFLSTSIATVVGGTSVLMQPQISRAATAKEIITTKSGIKYAITKEATDKKPTAPYKGESKSALRSWRRESLSQTKLSNLNLNFILSSHSFLGDFVAIDYTGYLANGQVRKIIMWTKSCNPNNNYGLSRNVVKIFDATHAEGKSNSLLFKLGSGSVIPGLDEIVSYMVVGQKVQAIIPPALAYGEKGVCLDDGECLIKPGSTLVYDVFLKRSSIPPP